VNPVTDKKRAGALWGTFIGDALAMPVHWFAWEYADNFEAGVIANANVGGDNCHRGAVVGALLGAAVGTARIPARFCGGLQAAAALRRSANPFAG
jgi:ADP-ribosyl-[dinitrogen reductase] hydrolase